MSAVSSPFRVHDGMHSEEERHFALEEKMADPTKARVVILSGQETRSDPYGLLTANRFVVLWINQHQVQTRTLQDVPHQLGALRFRLLGLLGVEAP
jgi:hypothetical protein